jgi:hypothetical protein
MVSVRYIDADVEALRALVDDPSGNCVEPFEPHGG